ncbi:cellulose-binding domain-containing protein [Glycomyces rhizosphaerae]|uniref:Cellulose-binding domain-containing protein n=1 Tax=Glycomyces rhizosphaerae TaxID=2054422 RepID=A0ABV7PSE8_9ACTN
MSHTTVHRPRWRLGAIVLAAITALTAGFIGAVSAQAAQGCQVDYEVTGQWPEGFTADVTVTNLGDPIDGWDLEWVWLEGQHVTQAWNATFATTAEQVNFANLGYNAEIASGSSVSFGFNGYWAGVNTNPTEFRLNGRVCDGSVGEPTTPPTSPPPTGSAA